MADFAPLCVLLPRGGVDGVRGALYAKKARKREIGGILCDFEEVSS